MILLRISYFKESYLQNCAHADCFQKVRGYLGAEFICREPQNPFKMPEFIPVGLPESIQMR